MGAKRDVVVHTRITEQGAAAVDKLRGGWSRAEWFRAAIADAAKRGLSGPRPS